MLLTDNPIPNASADDFGFREHADVLCQAIAATPALPLTVGVFGPWGSGKSSFLVICRELLAELGFATVMFNPWKYDQRDEIWHALIQSLLDELVRIGEESPDRRKDRIRKALEKAKDLSAAAMWLATRRAAPLLTAGVVTTDDVDAARDALAAPRGDDLALSYRHVNQFERDFADTVDALTGDRKLVVFIDDLDRCRREPALMALEALRLFTGDAPCVFVVAMDQEALIKAASAHFGDDLVKGREYLEKLISFPYHLPAARLESINKAIRDKLRFLSDDVTMWELIRANFGGNPRRIRRFVNAFNLAVETLSRNADPTVERQRQLAVLVMLRQEHPRFFERLRTDPGVWERLTAANGPAGRASLDPDDESLASADPGLLPALASVSARDGFEFPTPSTVDQVTVLTDAVVPVAPAPRLAGSPP